MRSTLGYVEPAVEVNGAPKDATCWLMATLDREGDRFGTHISRLAVGPGFSTLLRGACRLSFPRPVHHGTQQLQHHA